jgi:hypothetical protein
MANFLILGRSLVEEIFLRLKILIAHLSAFFEFFYVVKTLITKKIISGSWLDDINVNIQKILIIFSRPAVINQLKFFIKGGILITRGAHSIE